jgi:hypothetical protein
MAQVCDPGCEDFNRLQRRIDAADRSFHRALLALQKIESRAPDPRPLAPRAKRASPGPWPRERSEPPPAPGHWLPAPRAKRARNWLCSANSSTATLHRLSFPPNWAICPIFTNRPPLPGVANPNKTP